jgi:hypothetical protein
VPPGDAGALADALVRLAPTATGGDERRRRPARQPPATMARFAEIFRDAAAIGHRAR